MGLSEKEYLEYVRSNPEEYPGPNEPFEDHFEFNSLFYSVYRRFIELIYPGTSHFFRKTSKKNYQQCLDVRGIEVGKLCWWGDSHYHGELSLESGKMTLDWNRVPKNWTKCVVATDSVVIARPLHGAVPDMKQLDFVKKYKDLLFYHNFAEHLECLIHPGLETININVYSLEFGQLLRFLNKLNLCQHLDSITVFNYNVVSAAAFKKFKQQLEQLARCHPHAHIRCNLRHQKMFKIHENVLCHCPESGVFVKDYSFDNLSIDS